MAWKPKYPPDAPKRPKRSFDAPMGIIVVLAILVLAFGLDRVTRYATGESRVASASTPTVTIVGGERSITVVDGDTVRSAGVTYRLVGFDTPERGDRAMCEKERQLGDRATARLQQLLASGTGGLDRVPCACRTSTEGTQACNFGRLCARLRVAGTDVGDTLMREGLAQPFVCSGTSCPPRKPWC